MDAILNFVAGGHENLLLPVQVVDDGPLLVPLQAVDNEHPPQAPEHADDD